MKRLLRFFIVILVIVPWLNPSDGVSSTGREARPGGVRVVMDNNYPPYVFLDERGDLQGIVIDQWRLWEEKTGIPVAITAVDWAEALRRMEAGEFDVIDTIFFNERRAGIYDFSKPYARIDVSIFFDKDLSGITDAASLQGFPVAVKAGDAAVDYLKAKGVGLLQEYPSYEAIAKAAQERKVITAVMDNPPAHYFLHRAGIQDEFRHSPPLYSGAFHRAVRKGDTATLRLVEDGFALISESEYQSINRRWFGTETRLLEPYIRHILAGMGTIALIIVLLGLWNHTLRHKVRERTGRLEEQIALNAAKTEALEKSEEKYRELVEHANSIILRMDREGTITFFNEFAQRFFGFSEEEILGRNVVGTIVPERESSGRDLAAMIADMGRHPETYRNNENENMRRDGERVWIAWTNRPTYDSDGKVREILCVGNDITGRREMERQLREKTEEMDRYFSASLDLLCIADTDGFFRRLNPQWESTLGYPLQELEGHRFLEFVHPDDVAATLQAVSRLDRQEEVLSFTNRYRCKDGSYRWIEWRSVPRGNLIYAAARDITARVEAEERLRESEERLDLAMGVANDGLWDWNVAENRVFFDPRYFTMSGYEPNEFPHAFDEWAKRVHPDDIGRARKGIEDHFSGRSPVFDIEFRFLRKDGTWMWIRGRGKIVERDGKGAVVRMVGTHTDITERRRAEEERERLQAQLIQAQKMESVGRLAGGVAHDFNNMLGVIIGHAELALARLDQADPVFANLQEIRRAAERSSDLTRQLLAFARKQIVTPRVLDLNATVEGMLKMLRRLIGEDIQLVWLPGEKVGSVKMDPSQIDQILANLCVNARDAIGSTGRIVIETAAVSLDRAFCAGREGAVPGEHILLTITDTGCGMDRETLSRLFEPFFTTKETGKGTGLGLATVYGIVRQNNGFVEVESEPGRGTVFRIYLPAHSVGTGSPKSKSPDDISTFGHETILLVEDEPAILNMTAMMLRSQGYTVLPAATPREAISMAAEYGAPIHLLMTDVIMPEMNGRDLAETLLSFQPGLRRLFMSGYTADVIAHHGVLDEGVDFIQKPFSMKDLAVKTRKLLDRG